MFRKKLKDDKNGQFNDNINEGDMLEASSSGYENLSLSSGYSVYNDYPMNMEDSNDLRIHVDGRSEDDSSLNDDEFDAASSLLNENKEKKSSDIGIIIFVTIWIIIAILCVIFRVEIAHYIKKFSDKVSEIGPISFLYYIMIITVCLPLFIPIELMIISSGFVYSRIYGKLWGILLSSLSSFAGYLFGASICFIISKYLLYNVVKRVFSSNKYYTSINRAIDHVGLKVVAMLRVSPMLPASVISYMLGVTDITFFHYSIGNLAAYPGLLILSYLGSLLHDAVTDLSLFTNVWNILLMLLGVFLSVAGIVYTYRMSRNYIR